MFRYSYAANVDTEWRNFTPQHARSLEHALSIARGDDPVPTGAIVGVYGSGKSTLLLGARCSEPLSEVLQGGSVGTRSWRGRILCYVIDRTGLVQELVDA